MEKIKLPRCSYKELVKIIIAYGTVNKPSGLNDISSASGIAASFVSANNAFLSNLEIIEGGNKKNITQKGSRLFRALEHNLENEIQQSWTAVINENDFLTKMLQAVKIRKGMEITQLENHIAFSSGEVKSAYVMTGARAVVDILIASGQLKQDGDRLTFQDIGLTENVNAETRVEEIKSITINQPISTSSSLKDKQYGITLNIDLKINATPTELEGLGKKIKTLIEDLQSE